MMVPWALLCGVALVVLVLVALGCCRLPSAPTAAAAAPALPELLARHSVTLYGTEWCGYTTKQKAELGDAFAGVSYVDCEASADQCAADGVQAYPSWRIDGQLHEGYRSRGALEALLA